MLSHKNGNCHSSLGRKYQLAVLICKHQMLFVYTKCLQLKNIHCFVYKQPWHPISNGRLVNMITLTHHHLTLFTIQLFHWLSYTFLTCIFNSVMNSTKAVQSLFTIQFNSYYWVLIPTMSLPYKIHQLNQLIALISQTNLRGQRLFHLSTRITKLKEVAW